MMLAVVAFAYTTSRRGDSIVVVTPAATLRQRGHSQAWEQELRAAMLAIWQDLLMERAWHVYTLADPRSGAVRYVGWSFNPRQRLAGHMNEAKRKISHKGRWLQQLGGARPDLEVGESGEGPGWAAAERRWIAHFRTSGAPLTNLTDGGEGTPGFRPSAETRAKMSAARVGHRRSAESIAKTAAALRGRKQAQEHVSRLAAVRRGRVPLAAMEAARMAVTGRKQSPEHVGRRVASTAARGPRADRRLSDEQIVEIRISTKSLRSLAVEHGVGQTVIHGIKHRRRYKHVP